MATITPTMLTSVTAALDLLPFLSVVARGELAGRFAELGWTVEASQCPATAAAAVVEVLQQTAVEFQQQQQQQQQQLLVASQQQQQQQQSSAAFAAEVALEAAGKGLGGVGGGLGGDVGGGKGGKGKGKEGKKGKSVVAEVGADYFEIGDGGLVSMEGLWVAARKIEVAGVSAEMARVLARFIDPTKKGVPGAGLRQSLEDDLRDARQANDPEPKRVVAWIHQHMKEELADEKMPIEVKAQRLNRVLSALPPVPPNVGELGGAITALDKMEV
eukprot:TRINITY_DN1886_c1_g2_i1.p1 TRINITY_DN1886_c1_g2~~TRINITY_DN1886_c1_g2_i1.p1  ORF type:complete len:272 (+),score=83.66 TRINITY_DN1886_c1_g2_i1:94-909(+)